MLFSKILPALNDNPFSRPDPSPSSHPPRLSFSPPPPDLDEFDDDEGNVLMTLRDKLFARSSDLAQDAVATVNVMETLVLQNLDAVIEKFNVCRCDRCRCDVAAIALNYLPPKYIVTRPDRASLAVGTVTRRAVFDALIKAALTVRSEPRH